jgi:hypothetical protein
MEKKNISFSKEGGLKVGVKHVNQEDIDDKTQRYLLSPSFQRALTDG